VDLPRRIIPDPNDRIDREERREASSGGRKRSQDAQLGTIVAVVGIESIADKAAITGLASE
jgi:hypothetical protein